MFLALRAARAGRRVALLVLGTCSVAAPLPAQRSALRHFDAADGLPSPRVSSIASDSEGFLWITTQQGLARFDGRRFDVFGAQEGLARVAANEVREDRRGRLWVALNGDGLARLADEAVAPGQSLFRRLRVSDDRPGSTVNAIRFDSEDRLWLGTERGIARAVEAPDGELAVEYLPESVACLNPQGACGTPDGAFWFVGARGLACVREGVLAQHALPVPSAHPEYLCVAASSSAEVLVGDDRTLWSFAVADARWTRRPLELATNQGVRTLFVDSRGDTWVGTTNGLIRLRGAQQLLYTTEQGLPDNSIRCAFEDRGGRLWFGTWFGGVVQFGRGDVISWSRSAELPNPDVTGIFVGRDGRAYASTTNDGLFALDERGARRLGAELSPAYDRIWQRALEVPGRGWIFGTEAGLHTVPSPGIDLSRARFLGPESGCGDLRPIALAPGDAPGTVLASDSTGRLLRGTLAPDGTAEFVDLIPAEQRAPFLQRLSDAPRHVACTPDGTVWVASRFALARLRRGELEFVAPGDGLPTTEVRALLCDAAGRLWVALRYDGASVCEDPRAQTLRWKSVEALRGESTFALAEDRAGQVFVGTWSGVFMLDARTELLRRFSSASGLVSDTVNQLAVDGDGRVWAATSAGVTRLDPAAESRSLAAPATWIERVEVDGTPLAIPRRAARALGPLALDAGLGTLLVEFGAPWLSSDEPLLYQIRLDGESTEWSRPQAEPQVRFVRLAPGDYTLEVRAVLATSGAAGEPARIEFGIPPPFWRRGWFLAACALIAAGISLAWHRVRLRQALALERVRSQIALDLHDELGADLTQVAILAELARRESAAAGGDALGKVAELARDMRESLADIVWSVDPRRDRVADLVVRLREVGNRLVEAGGLEFTLAVDADRPMETLPLAPDERRGLYLIVKESLHNAVRHARASRVDVAIAVHGPRLTVLVRDDGAGFDVEAAHTGHGLRSLRTRAAALGAELALRSQEGGGTSVELELRLRGGPA